MIKLIKQLLRGEVRLAFVEKTILAPKLDERPINNESTFHASTDDFKIAHNARIRREIAQRLKYVRSEHFFTQFEMDKRLNLTLGKTAKLENCYFMPSENVLEKYHKEFGVRKAWLRFGELPMYETEQHSNQTKIN